MEGQTIQWFPGHMKKTERMIQKDLPLVDLVLEIIDARLPKSSRNPVLGEIIGGKPRMVVLNKSDLADPSATKLWAKKIEDEGALTVPVDCKTGSGINQVVPKMRESLAGVIEKRSKKGMTGRIIRAMVVGIPNVGKSTIINRLAGGKRTKAEDRPGVTRGKQWVKLANDVDLLDMPGVLWPKFEDPSIGEKLAFTGAVKDTILDTQHLAVRLLAYLCEYYPALLEARYKVEDTEDMEPFERLEAIAKRRGMLLPGGEIDTERAAVMLLDEFRGGKLGRITLDRA